MSHWLSVKWSGVSTMVEAFSLLAIGTSLIGTLLGFSEFFKEQLNDLSWISAPRKIIQANKYPIFFTSHKQIAYLVTT